MTPPEKDAEDYGPLMAEHDATQADLMRTDDDEDETDG